MLIYDDIYSWEGWGGTLRLASGKCRLRIFDLTEKNRDRLAHLRPIIVIASDVPDSKMSVRSCCGQKGSMSLKKNTMWLNLTGLMTKPLNPNGEL
jgi:hypothetical protein